jgi:hypothetical protein
MANDLIPISVPITVSIDSSCNLIVSQPSGAGGATVTWSIDRTGVITNITQGNAFTAPPAIVKGVWTAILESGFIGDVSYQIDVTPSNTLVCGSTSKQKTPRIAVIAPEPATTY